MSELDSHPGCSDLKNEMKVKKQVSEWHIDYPYIKMLNFIMHILFMFATYIIKVENIGFLEEAML